MSKKRTASGIARELAIAVDRIDRLVATYAARIVSRKVDDPDLLGRARDCVRRVLCYHVEQYRLAEKPCDPEALIEHLAQGRFALGTRPDCDLWADLFLALFFGEGMDEAAEAFHRRFADQLTRWARRYGAGDHDLADDLMADLLLPRASAGPRIETYLAHGPLESWLRQVVRSQADRRRRRRGVVVSPPEADGHQDSHDNLTFSASQYQTVIPDEQYAHQECTRHLAPLFTRVLDELDPQERAVLLLSVADGVAQNRVAQLLGVPDYKVSRLKSQAIETVRRRFFALARQTLQMDEEVVQGCLRLIMDAFPQAGLRVVGDDDPAAGE